MIFLRAWGVAQFERRLQVHLVARREPVLAFKWIVMFLALIRTGRVAPVRFGILDQIAEIAIESRISQAWINRQRDAVMSSRKRVVSIVRTAERPAQEQVPLGKVWE